MSDRERERLFWHLTLVLCLASPAAFLGFQKLQLKFPSVLVAMLMFAVLLVLALLIPMLIELVAAVLLGRPVRLGLKNLTTHIDEQVPRPLEEVQADAVGRLTQLGFIAAPSEDGSTIIFIKMGKPEANHFMDHEFAGRLTCSSTAYGTRVQVDLTFKETVVIDTGETNKLTKLGRQICGIDAAEESPNMPFIVPVGFSSALIIIALGIISHFSPPPNTWAPIAAGVGFLMNFSALRQVYSNPARHFGRRISAASLYLTALPIFSMVVKLAAKDA